MNFYQYYLHRACANYIAYNMLIGFTYYLYLTIADTIIFNEYKLVGRYRFIIPNVYITIFYNNEVGEWNINRTSS